MKRLHTGEKPYTTCDTCGKRFSHSGKVFKFERNILRIKTMEI